jgi:hypothetical protein
MVSERCQCEEPDLAMSQVDTVKPCALYLMSTCNALLTGATPQRPACMAAADLILWQLSFLQRICCIADGHVSSHTFKVKALAS